MKTSDLRLGYLESISQVLALKKEQLATEHENIKQLLETADETMFYQLVPHLFITRNSEEPLVANRMEATSDGYRYFKQLLNEEVE